MLHPVDAFGLLGPKSVRVSERLLVHLFVLSFVDEGPLGPLGRHIVNLVRHHILHAAHRHARLYSSTHDLFETPETTFPDHAPVTAIMRRRPDKRQDLRPNA